MTSAKAQAAAREETSLGEDKKSDIECWTSRVAKPAYI